MPEFSRKNIILHQFHVDNNKGESGMGYGIIMGRNLLVQLYLMSDFKRKLFKGTELQYQWNIQEFSRNFF